MATVESAVYTNSKLNREMVMRFLTKRWVDKTLAVLAISPFVLDAAFNYKSFHFEIPSLSYLADVLVVVGTMVFRRTPVRVTPNPWFWALAFVATYWSFMTWGLAEHGRALAPTWFLNTLALVSVAVELWGRFSLGRNIGFVPAQREIVIQGAYRYMRHPIYGGLFIGVLGECLAYYSPRNLVLCFFAIFWFVIKSFVEESFLRQDQAYAAYMQRVRWRWIPGLA